MGEIPEAFKVENAKRTKEDWRAFASAGGKACHAARERRKTFKAIAEALMDIPLKGQGEMMEPGVAKCLRQFGLKEKDMTVRTAIMLALIKKATTGNIDAIERLVKMTGEPLDNTQLAKLTEKKTRLNNEKQKLAMDIVKQERAEGGNSGALEFCWKDGDSG